MSRKGSTAAGRHGYNGGSMRDWVGRGTFVLGVVLVLTAIALLIRWCLVARGQPPHRRSASHGMMIPQPWMALGYLGTGLIQLGAVITADHPWWAPSAWLFLA